MEEELEGKKYTREEIGEIFTIPRHKEIDENFAKKICKDLGIPKPYK